MSQLTPMARAAAVIAIGAMLALVAMRLAVGEYVGEEAWLGLSPANRTFALASSVVPNLGAWIVGEVLRRQKSRWSWPVTFALLAGGTSSLWLFWAASASA